MSIVRVHASAMNVGYDVTILRYSFFEILELILHAYNVNHMIVYIPYVLLYFLGRFTFTVSTIFNLRSLVQLTIKSTVAH